MGEPITKSASAQQNVAISKALGVDGKYSIGTELTNRKREVAHEGSGQREGGVSYETGQRVVVNNVNTLRQVGRVSSVGYGDGMQRILDGKRHVGGYVDKGGNIYRKDGSNTGEKLPVKSNGGGGQVQNYKSNATHRGSKTINVGSDAPNTINGGKGSDFKRLSSGAARKSNKAKSRRARR